MNEQLREILVLLASGGGAGTAAYWLWGVLERNFKGVGELNKEIKGYLTLILTAAIAVLAYGGQLAMNYAPMPTLATEWIEVIFAIGFGALVTSKAIHARRQLRGK